MDVLLMIDTFMVEIRENGFKSESLHKILDWFPCKLSDFFKFQSTCYISSYNGLIEIKDPEIKTNLLKCPFITTVNHSP